MHRCNSYKVFLFTCVWLLWRRTATCLQRCSLASASSVVLQALQNALRQPFDVLVGLWVCMNELQLLQAALLQQHAAVTSGCERTGRHKIKSVSCLGKVNK